MRKENQEDDAQTDTVIIPLTPEVVGITLQEVNKLHDEIATLKRENRSLKSENTSLRIKVERAKKDAKFPEALSFNSLEDWFNNLLWNLRPRKKSGHIPNPKKIAVLLFDGDDFGMVNKEKDYIAGDSLIETYIQTVKSHIKESDLLFRWGGDELIVVLRGKQSNRSVKRAVERLNKLVITVRCEDQTEISRTVSVGGQIFTLTHRSTAKDFSYILRTLSDIVNEIKERKKKLSQINSHH